MALVRESATVPTLPPPRPRSPPEYPDLYGKRRVLAKVQMLEREIGFLRDELKSIEGLEPASKSCKEVADFVNGNPDPLIPTATKGRRSFGFWKWLCGSSSSSSSSCLKISWLCCCNGRPNCCSERETYCKCADECCRMPKCKCFTNSCCWCKCIFKCKCPSFDDCCRLPSKCCCSCSSWSFICRLPSKCPSCSCICYPPCRYTC